MHLQHEELLRKEKWLEGNWNWVRTEEGDSFPVSLFKENETEGEYVSEWNGLVKRSFFLSFFVSFVQF